MSEIQKYDADQILTGLDNDDFNMDSEFVTASDHEAALADRDRRIGTLRSDLTDEQNRYHAALKLCDEKEAAIAALRAQVAELKDKLPEEMPNRKIFFRSCNAGHGRLIGENWIDPGCPYCKVAKLTAAEERRRQEVIELTIKMHELEAANKELDKGVGGMIAKDIFCSIVCGIFVLAGCESMGLPQEASVYFGAASMFLGFVWVTWE